jgi:hypothetical protein
VNKVVDDDLIPAVGVLLEVAGKCWMCLEQRVERLRHGFDVDGAFYLRTETHEIACLREHFLTARQLTKD